MYGYILQVYSGSLHKTTPYASIFCIKSTTSAEVVQKALDKFGITDHAGEFQLAEVVSLQILMHPMVKCQNGLVVLLFYSLPPSGREIAIKRELNFLCRVAISNEQAS